ncbi:hypothetical protein [Paenibacillus sp. SYP-B3998]|nr:hypothetical protein [Paenibacillus sp. SYP-B3998]
MLLATDARCNLFMIAFNYIAEPVGPISRLLHAFAADLLTFKST